MKNKLDKPKKKINIANGIKLNNSLKVKLSAIHNQQLFSLEVVKKETSRPNKTISAAFECIQVFSSLEEMSLEEVNGIYGKTAGKLIAQINRRNQKNKDQYADLLMDSFTAYLNRLMILQPNRPIGKAEELIGKTGKTFAAIGDYPVEDIFPLWKQSVHGISKNSFVSRVRKIFYRALT